MNLACFFLLIHAYFYVIFWINWKLGWGGVTLVLLYSILWCLARNKTDITEFRNRINEVLFIDLREFGTMISCKQRELTDNDITNIAYIYHNWRSKEQFAEYKDIAGFCKSANIQDICRNNYILTPM